MIEKKNCLSTFSRQQVLNHLLLLLAVIFLSCSCNHEMRKTDPKEDTGCEYQFADNADDIFGVWEPKAIIDLETGDTTFYEPGEGHFGFIFKYYYADAFELREDNNLALYYTESGRWCASRVDGSWIQQNNQIIILPISDSIILPIISLSKEELIIDDEINFKNSRAVMRKVN